MRRTHPAVSFAQIFFSNMGALPEPQDAVTRRPWLILDPSFVVCGSTSTSF